MNPGNKIERVGASINSGNIRHRVYYRRDMSGLLCTVGMQSVLHALCRWMCFCYWEVSSWVLLLMKPAWYLSLAVEGASWRCCLIVLQDKCPGTIKVVFQSRLKVSWCHQGGISIKPPSFSHFVVLKGWNVTSWSCPRTEKILASIGIWYYVLLLLFINFSFPTFSILAEGIIWDFSWVEIENVVVETWVAVMMFASLNATSQKWW